ncbi:DUF3800 domain-containing protein [Leptospira adleri]|uniref:DUF3800 domain-containing protein n=1 Tax=Leptospira adleri TaxID=2023186 RepID=A0A2M9YJ05_9LEPT|nr:DUF3800 domain-containing protein [Leptospira adleri]PJZ51523.1 hypothetical protein CH380_19750 [Leptospira adleri]PJZ61569.1 hypothetical protein CH376_12335 [Leptospira adleri]
MYLCYLDESGTPSIPGNTSHYVLAGISIPVKYWSNSERQIDIIKRKFNLEGSEIHTGWILRSYIEQQNIPNFESLNYISRRQEVEKLRISEIHRLQRLGNSKRLKQTKKNYRETTPYIHLTHSERLNFITELAHTIANWSYARLFAECIDKLHFNPTISARPLDEHALEQIVNRFHKYLEIMDRSAQVPESYGLLIHDNNDTVEKRHTDLMRHFHNHGTFWGNITKIIETPLFVDSKLTSMIQIADLCSYSLRRYLENSEDTLFNIIFQRADRINNAVVGVRHFTSQTCNCKICTSRH